MERAVSVEVMRQSDAWTIANKVPSKELMRRAGEGIFHAVEWKSPVAVVCGSGNNAGDGYVVADLLHKNGLDVTIVLASEKFSEDGKYYFDICLEEKIPVVRFDKDGGADPVYPVVSDLHGFSSILDCLLGTGFQGEPRGRIKDAILAINHSDAYVVSADINSGLNGDTGMGTLFVKSDLTVSIGDYKIGHFKGLADSAMKTKVNVDIGIVIQGEYLWF